MSVATRAAELEVKMGSAASSFVALQRRIVVVSVLAFLPATALAQQDRITGQIDRHRTGRPEGQRQSQGLAKYRDLIEGTFPQPILF